MAHPRSQHIVIIGAGITGLQTATTLQTAGYNNVTIVAEYFPGDESPEYTSPWAGGQWRSHAHEGEEEQQGWDAETYRAWMEDLRGGKGREMGLGRVPSTLYWSDESDHHDWWYDLVEDFTLLAAKDLPQGVRSGVRFSTICINVPKYLLFLLSKFEAAGGKTVKARLPSGGCFVSTLDNVAALVLGKVDSYVNATGIGAKALVGDEGVFPVKGQTVLVKGESKFAVTKDENCYVIPRPGSGTTIIGGTREAGVWKADVNEEATMAILDGCKQLAPKLLTEDGNFEVLSVQCGLRPARKGGPRVEYELVGETRCVIHSYGHAGAGYQNAVGSAQKVLTLLEKELAV